MESEIRTRKSPLMQSMIDAVRGALGPYDDETLIRTIGYCRSTVSAVKRCSAVLDIRAKSAQDPEAPMNCGVCDEPSVPGEWRHQSWCGFAQLNEAEAATLAAATAVVDGTGTIEDLNAALFPDGVAAEFAQMEAEGRIVDETGQLDWSPDTAPELAELNAAVATDDWTVVEATMDAMEADKPKRARKPRDPNAAPRTRRGRKPAAE